MKRNLMKIFTVMLALVACLAIVACGEKLAIDEEDMDWEIVLVSDDRTGKVLYCAAEFKDVYPDAVTLDLSCEASNGKLVIMNEKTDIGYLGTYTVDKAGNESSYNVVMTGENGKLEGYAEVTKATLYNDTVEYNLIIVIDGYTLHFKSVDK